MARVACLLVCVLLLASCVSYRNRPAAENGDSASVPTRQSGTSLRELTCDDCARFLEGRPFASREALFQLFFDIYFAPGYDGVVLKKEAIAALAEQLHTYFPLGTCEEISLSDGLLAFRFPENLAVPIPGTFRQASMSLTKKLVLKVTHADKARGTMRFAVAGGGMRLNVSAAMKAMLDYARDIQVTELTYEIDPEKRCSSVGIRERRFLPRKSLVITRDGDSVMIDVRHPDLPDPVDLSFTKNTMNQFGISFTLQDDGRSGMPGGKVDENDQRHAALAAYLGAVLEDPEKVFQHGMYQIVDSAYDLEEERLSFHVGIVAMPSRQGAGQ